MQLSGWLKAETSKPRKQRRNLKQIHADLKELGYEGSYGRVAAFARQWKAGQTEWVNSSSKRTPSGQSYAFIDDSVAYIASERFQPDLSFADIAEEAEMLLAGWQPTIELLSPGFQTLAIDAVVEDDDDGTRTAIVLAAGHIKMRFRALSAEFRANKVANK